MIDLKDRAGSPPATSHSARFIRSFVERRDRATTLVVATLAMLISLVGSWVPSLWADEAYTVTVATRSVADVWRMAQTIDIVHSLYALLLHPWLAIAGVSEMSLRLPSVLSVGVAAAGVCVLARRLVGPEASVAAGLVFAVLPRVTWMGIEGRSYAATAVVAVWLTVLLVSYLARATTWKLVAYSVLGAFGVALNIFLLLIVAAHGLTLLVDQRTRFGRKFWAWLISALAAVLGSLPVLYEATTQAGQIGPTRLDALGWVRSVTVNQWFLGDTPTIFLSGGRVIDAPGLDLWKPAAVALALVCWCLVLLGLRALHPNNASSPPPPDSRALLLSWLAVPTLILVSYALLATPIYNPRYLTFGAPALAILVGAGLVSLRRRRTRWLAAGLILLLAAPVYFSQRTVYAKSGADWREVANFVGQRRDANQGIYYAPRGVVTSDEVGVTTRTGSLVYPAAFAGLRDITLVRTPAQQGDLVGRSATLENARGRLAGLDAVFVVRRGDSAPAAVAAEDRVLADAGLVPVDSWAGPLNKVVEYRRS